MSLQRQKATIRVYATGGASINIVTPIYNWRKEDKDGFANVKFAFIDTSKSNFRSPVDEEDIYLIDGLDGQGGKRGLNAPDKILPVISDIVQTMSPANLNIVLHSLSGGSGASIGPAITKELMRRDLPTIVIGIGDQSAVKDAENTINTLKTYENISINVLKKPIVLAYYYNEGSLSRKEVNKYIVNLMESLRCLFANQHIGLDSQDLFHWLRYDKVSDYPVQLSILTMVGENDDLRKVYGKAISVATLAAEGESTDYPETVDFHREGEIPKELCDKIYSKTTHFVISEGLVDKVVKDIESNLSKVKEEKDSRIIRPSIVTKDDQADEHGMIW